MAKSNKTKQLSIEQENAIDWLIQGKRDREVAEAVKVNRSTVNHWRNHDAVFIAELNARREELWNCETERLRTLVEKAVDVLKSDLDSEDLKLRQSAAVHLLRAVGLYGADLKPTGQTNPDAIESDWKWQGSLSSLSGKT